jgi:hypothetical protein
MKIIIFILCGLAIVFSGGCAVIMLNGPDGREYATLPLAILAFNAFFIWAARSEAAWSATVLMLCGLVDLFVAVVFLLTFKDPSMGGYAVIAAALFALKAIAGLKLGYDRAKGSKEAPLAGTDPSHRQKGVVPTVLAAIVAFLAMAAIFFFT